MSGRNRDWHVLGKAEIENQGASGSGRGSTFQQLPSAFSYFTGCQSYF
jgi:hypothetical protein